MKTHTFNIPMLDFKIKLIQITSKKDYIQVKKHEWLQDIPDEDREEIFQNVKEDVCDGACVLRNLNMKQLIVVFYRFESEEKRVNVYAHEKRHVEDRIMEYLHIEDFEAAGYLAGFLAVEFNKFHNQV
jgi:hypothetical protein